MKRSDKQPWNPFPLAVLTVEGISRGAAHVLTVLGARSNYKGEVCVGHRGLVRDCKSSKQYVSDALKELYDKGIVQRHPRKRSFKQADWKIINPTVLKSRTTDKIQSSYPVGLNNPTEQDDSNPTQQGRTLQKEENLTEENLADSSFFPSVSLGADAPVAQEQKEKSNPDGLNLSSEEQRQNQPEEPDPELDALTEELLNAGGLSVALGLPYFTVAHVPSARCIAAALRSRNRSVCWFKALVDWAKFNAKDREARFWKQRLQTGDAAMLKLAEFMEKGTIAEQFDVHMMGSGRDLEVHNGEENSLLYRDGRWWQQYQLGRGQCDTCYEPQSQCQCRVADETKPIYETRREGSFSAGHETKPKFPEPGSMEELMAQNQAKAAVSGFDEEEA